jgi:hypothetical protein
MRIIHSGGFSGEELLYFKNTLVANIFLGLKSLLAAAQEADKALESDKVRCMGPFIFVAPHG